MEKNNVYILRFPTQDTTCQHKTPLVNITLNITLNMKIKGGRTWILCGSKGMYMVRLRGSVSGNLKHATAAPVYIAELAGDRL